MSPKRSARKKKKSLSHRGRGARSTVVGAGENDKRDRNKQAPPRPPTGRRLWLFRILAATVVPAILLLLVELSLRLSGYGFNPDAIVTCQIDGKDVYCDNGEFTWRFFPRNIARQFEPFVFPVDKSADAYRIFVLGASAARGEPDPAFSFTRFLQLMLEDQYPETKFELVNTAVVAINSHVVLEIAKDCARYDPDLFIVYLGNNEVTGPYGAGTVYTRPSVNLSLVRLGIALKGTRLGQLLAGVVESAGAAKGTPKVWRGLEMYLDNQVRADSPNLEAVYANYEKNLRDIGHVARKGGAEIVFCTVASNLKDCPPFASLHRSDLTAAEREEWRDIYGQGVELESTGDHAGAVERYLSAAQIDPLYADLQFRLGRCYWAQGEYEKAIALNLDRSATALVLTEALLLRDGGGTPDGVKSIRFLKRRADLSPEEFQARWRDAYGPLVEALPGLTRYVQYRARLGGYQAGRAPVYDGFDVTWFAGVDGLRVALASPAAASARRAAAGFLADGEPVGLVTHELSLIG